MEREQFLDAISSVISDEFRLSQEDTILVSRLGIIARRALGGPIWQSLGFPNFRTVLEELEARGKLKCDIDSKDAFIVRRQSPYCHPTNPEYVAAQPITKLHRLVRLRPPVWDAFVREHPTYGLRFINTSTGEIVVGTKEAPVPIEHWKVVSPITAATQQSWASEFVRERCPEIESKIADFFQGSAWFTEFAKLLRGINSELIAEWNRYRSKQVVCMIEDWCKANDVSFELMATVPSGNERTPRHADGQLDASNSGRNQVEGRGLRMKLLAVLAKVPTDELLNLKVSLKYLVSEDPEHDVSDSF